MFFIVNFIIRSTRTVIYLYADKFLFIVFHYMSTTFLTLKFTVNCFKYYIKSHVTSSSIHYSLYIYEILLRWVNNYILKQDDYTHIVKIIQTSFEFRVTSTK